jgi:hypothetical protein
MDRAIYLSYPDCFELLHRGDDCRVGCCWPRPEAAGYFGFGRGKGVKSCRVRRQHGDAKEQWSPLCCTDGSFLVPAAMKTSGPGWIRSRRRRRHSRTTTARAYVSCCSTVSIVQLRSRLARGPLSGQPMTYTAAED